MNSFVRITTLFICYLFAQRPYTYNYLLLRLPHRFFYYVYALATS